MNGTTDAPGQDAPLQELRRVLDRLFAMVSPISEPGSGVTIDLRPPEERHGVAHRRAAHPVA